MQIPHRADKFDPKSELGAAQLLLAQFKNVIQRMQILAHQVSILSDKMTSLAYVAGRTHASFVLLLGLRTSLGSSLGGRGKSASGEGSKSFLNEYKEYLKLKEEDRQKEDQRWEKIQQRQKQEQQERKKQLEEEHQREDQRWETIKQEQQERKKQTEEERQRRKQESQEHWDKEQQRRSEYYRQQREDNLKEKMEKEAVFQEYRKELTLSGGRITPEQFLAKKQAPDKKVWALQNYLGMAGEGEEGLYAVKELKRNLSGMTISPELQEAFVNLAAHLKDPQKSSSHADVPLLLQQIRTVVERDLQGIQPSPSPVPAAVSPGTTSSSVPVASSSPSSGSASGSHPLAAASNLGPSLSSLASSAGTTSPSSAVTPEEMERIALTLNKHYHRTSSPQTYTHLKDVLEKLQGQGNAWAKGQLENLVPPGIHKMERDIGRMEHKIEKLKKLTNSLSADNPSFDKGLDKLHQLQDEQEKLKEKYAEILLLAPDSASQKLSGTPDPVPAQDLMGGFYPSSPSSAPGTSDWDAFMKPPSEGKTYAFNALDQLRQHKERIEGEFQNQPGAFDDESKKEEYREVLRKMEEIKNGLKSGKIQKDTVIDQPNITRKAKVEEEVQSQSLKGSKVRQAWDKLLVRMENRFGKDNKAVRGLHWLSEQDESGESRFGRGLNKAGAVGGAVAGGIAAAGMGVLSAGAPDAFATITGSFQLLMAKFAGILIPVAVDVARWLQNLAKYVGSLSGTTRTVIASFVKWGLIAGVGLTTLSKVWSTGKMLAEIFVLMGVKGGLAVGAIGLLALGVYKFVDWLKNRKKEENDAKEEVERSKKEYANITEEEDYKNAMRLSPADRERFVTKKIQELKDERFAEESYIQGRDRKKDTESLKKVAELNRRINSYQYGKDTLSLQRMEQSYEYNQRALNKFKDLGRAPEFKEKVTRVIDGDTIETESGRRVRLKGTSAVEIYEPGGPEAKALLKKKVLGKEITVRMDPLDKKTGYRDSKGRLLGYYDLEEGGGRRDIGREMQRERPDIFSVSEFPGMRRSSYMGTGDSPEELAETQKKLTQRIKELRKSVDDRRDIKADEQRNDEILIALASMKAQPQFSSVEEAYKRVQIEALGKSPLELALERENLKNREIWLESVGIQKEQLQAMRSAYQIQ